jgi:hypothetical protein
VQPSDRELSAILGEGGILAAALPGFRFRPQQLAMAEAVADAIASPRRTDRRSRHGYRQDLRVSRAGAPVRRQGNRVHRHQDPAGPAVPARPPARPRRVEGARHARAAQGARELRLPPSSRANRERRAPSFARGRAAPAEDHRLRPRLRHRRSRRARRRPRKRIDLAARDFDAGQLPRRRMRIPRRLLRAEGAQGSAGSGRRRRQPPPLLRRRDAAGRGARRAAPGVQYVDPRRGASAARYGDALFRRGVDVRPAGRARARRRGRGPHGSARSRRASGRRGGNRPRHQKASPRAG